MTFKEYLEIEESNWAKTAKRAVLVATAGAALAGGLKLVDKMTHKTQKPAPVLKDKYGPDSNLQQQIFKQDIEEKKKQEEDEEKFRKIMKEKR